MNAIQKIEEYGFECEAGSLHFCIDWESLKKCVDLWIVKVREQICMHTSGNGGWRFMVFTNEKEAEYYANRTNKECFEGAPFCIVGKLLDNVTIGANGNVWPPP